MNDLLDIEDDRSNRSKKHRPIPSGKVSLIHASIFIPILLTTSFYISGKFLPFEFNIFLVCYYSLTLAYSFYLKTKVLLDVQVLAGLYTLRIVSGTAVIGAEYSFWLMTFSIFLFLSLALVKRYTELLSAKLLGSEIKSSRGYKVNDLDLLSSLGGASGYISVSIFALFINSDQITEKYSSPELLWFMIPILLYWVSRVWIIAHRGDMEDDPIIFAIKDNVSRFVAITLAVVLYGAMML